MESSIGKRTTYCFTTSFIRDPKDKRADVAEVKLEFAKTQWNGFYC